MTEYIITCVTKNGKPLNPSLYSWDEETRTFSTTENGLVLDFTGGHNCTFKTGSNCIFKTGHNCTFKTANNCTFETGSNCIFITGHNCKFKTSSNCIFKTSYDCEFLTGSDCVFKTGFDCKFNTVDDCIFKTSSDCKFLTGFNCIFTTGHSCKFTTSFDCIFKTGNNSEFKTAFDCVIIRRDEFEVIQPLEDEVIKLCPCRTKGYISKRKNENAFYIDIDGERVEHIIADGILSKVVKKRGNVYHVINHGEDEISFIVTDGEKFSHGATLEEAKNDLKYKLSSRDTSAYKDLTLKSVLTLEEAIKMYRTITGACERGTKIFVEQVLKTPEENYTVSEVIDLTKGRWNHDLLVKFFDCKEGELK